MQIRQDKIILDRKLFRQRCTELGITVDNSKETLGMPRPTLAILRLRENHPITLKTARRIKAKMGEDVLVHKPQTIIL